MGMVGKRLKRLRCRNCDELFERTQDTKRFCSSRCRFEYHRYGFPRKRIQELVEKEVSKQLEAFKKEQEFIETISEPGW